VVTSTECDGRRPAPRERAIPRARPPDRHRRLSLPGPPRLLTSSLGWHPQYYRFRLPLEVNKRTGPRQPAGAPLTRIPASPLPGRTYLPGASFKVPSRARRQLLDLHPDTPGFHRSGRTAARCNVTGGGMGRTHNRQDTFAPARPIPPLLAAEHISDRHGRRPASAHQRDQDCPPLPG